MTVSTRDVLITRAVREKIIPGPEYADALERVCEFEEVLSMNAVDREWIRQIILEEYEKGDDYDDSQDHTRCPDCNGSGKYVGFTDVKNCPNCYGAGWV